jgi:tetratricopeptide (TPR) repeat protein
LAQESARKVLDLADEHEYQVWTAAGSSLLGSSLARKGMTDEGLELLQDGIKAYRGLKSPPVFLPLLLYLNATALGQAGRTAEALECLEAAFAASSPDANPGLAAEFLRLQGDLMLATSRDNAPQVESVYQLGTGFAQKAEAKIFELRIATRLGRLWQSQGKAAEARVLLDEIYGKFTEGFDTIDLKTAKELLTELSD